MRRAVRVLSGLTLALTVVSVILFVATLYTWKAISQVRDLERKIDDIGVFEKRISNRLDLFNTGIQSQIEKTNSRISSIQVQLDKSISDNRDALTRLDAAAAQLTRRINAYPPAGSLGEANTDQPASLPVQRSVPGRSQTTSGAVDVPAHAGQAGFRRIIEPNGSVKYEKIR
jgi:hypothetical protein